jgi:SAM-dependent methyltransferase
MFEGVFTAEASRVDIFDVDARPLRETPGGEHIWNGRARFASIYNLPVETEAYDVVGFHSATYDASSPPYAVKELARIVRPGGLVCIAHEIIRTGDGRSGATHDLPRLLAEFGLEAVSVAGDQAGASGIGDAHSPARPDAVGVVILRRLR